MERSCACAALLAFGIITFTRGQHHDIHKDVQKFQLYQGSDYNNQYIGVTNTPTTNKQLNRQKNKHKSEQTHNEEIRKTAVYNQYEYIFATTENQKRNINKINSTEATSNSINAINMNSGGNNLNHQAINENLNHKTADNIYFPGLLNNRRHSNVFGVRNPIKKGSANNSVNSNNNRVTPNNNKNKNPTTKNKIKREDSNNFGNTFDPNRIIFPDSEENIFYTSSEVQRAPASLPRLPNRPGSDKITTLDQIDAKPKVLKGRDEDSMSEREKKHYVDLAENMCDYYKSLLVKKVSVLPLIPSPNSTYIVVSDCPYNNVPIIWANMPSIREFPHMALVGWKKITTSGYSWKCGGSLISDQYILTAGHCTYQDIDEDAVRGPPQAVQLGSSLRDDPEAVVVLISTIVRHPKYEARTAYHDIALIKMASKVTFSKVIHPACLGVPPPEGSTVIATGWGKSEFGGDPSPHLRRVNLPVWGMSECQEALGTSRKLPKGVTPDSHMCAGVKSGGEGTCQGDSGGPVQIQDGCLWRVTGVTSYGRSCGAAHTPSLYAVIPRAFVAAHVFDNFIIN